MSEKGQSALEYMMLSGLVTAVAILTLSFFYSGKSIESILGAWGKGLAEQVAGDRMDAVGPNWAED
jgi:hypothetical protein